MAESCMQDQRLLDELIADGQEHLTSGWSEAGEASQKGTLGSFKSCEDAACKLMLSPTPSGDSYISHNTDAEDWCHKDWPDFVHTIAGVTDEDKQRLVAQLVQLDEAYPGGLLQYVRNARRLLRNSREGALCRLVAHRLPDVCQQQQHVSGSWRLLTACGMCTLSREERF